MFSAVFVLCCLMVAVWFIRTERDQVRIAVEQLTLFRLTVSFSLALVAMVAMLQCWVHVVRAFGVPISLRVARGIFPAAQMGKYIPGGIWPVVVQTALGRRAGLTAAVMASAGVVNLALSVGVALLVGGLLILSSSSASAASWCLVAAPMGAAILLILYPPMTRRLRPVLARIRWAPVFLQLIPSSGREVTLAVGWCIFAQLIFGLHIHLLIPHSGLNLATVALATAAYSLAAVAGVLVVLAPAGAGVREATLVLLLQPVVPLPEALVIAISSRLLLVVVDLVLFASQARKFREIMLATRPPDAEDNSAVHP